MQELLTYQSVEISFGADAVVHEVSFSLHSGEIFGIVGESGSGKSTLLKAALGLLGNTGMVTKGDIFFEGKDLPDLPEKEMRLIRGAEIGMIFQNSKESFCPVRTVGSQITESLRAHEKITRGEAKERTLEIFEKLNFQDPETVWESYPFELSGGMNQRVGIAAAMLCRPKILLADEPTSALDMISQKQVIVEMLRLRELSGVSVLLVTHDIGVVSALADRILVLKGGRIMEYGEAEQVLSSPQNEYTKELLAAVPRLQKPK